MMTISTTWCGRLASRFAVFAAATVVLGCGIEKQSAPALTGPSEFALSLTVTASPDTIVANGESQSIIRAVARDPNGQPVPNVTLTFDVWVDQLISAPSLTQTTAVTDAAGQATIGLVAPPAPATVFATDPVVTVRATPVGSDFSNDRARSVQVRLVAPEGTPRGSRNPVAVIVANPPVANYNEAIRFDASLSTDEGLTCGDRCQYIWEFGDDTATVRGKTVEHTFTVPGTFTVTLTVTDDMGGVGTTTVSIRVIGPSAPVANFTVSPASPAAGVTATFNASASSVGAGASITQYAWDFGDGAAVETTSNTTRSHAFGVAGTYGVTLTVTDSLGRTASRTSNVTVQ